MDEEQKAKDIKALFQVIRTHAKSPSIYRKGDQDEILEALEFLEILIDQLTEPQKKVSNHMAQPEAKQGIEEPETVKRCDYCHKEVDQLYDLTPAGVGDLTTI